ncbi:MAG: hypothetical protein ACNI3A_09180 [Desulfovibrio sp.]|uniref:hypothetical protein n=1 Tax=Desulfovibrio sp. 7SRBS1 TaxID=3378064 RepID=UPI003B3E9518
MLISEVFTVALLIVSAVNMALMIPGGFVETRDFSAYSKLTLGAFNLFLTILGLGSFVLAWRIALTNTGFELAMASGLLYSMVYIADLGLIFPVSPSPMSPLLARLEALGATLGGALAMVGASALWNHPLERTNERELPLTVIIVLVLGGIAIIAFATRAAMKGK